MIPPRLRLLAAASLQIACLLVAPAMTGPAEDPTEKQIQAAFAAGRFQEAESAARSLVDARQAAFGPEAPETAVALGWLVEALTRNDKAALQETVDLAEQAVAIEEKTLGSEAPEVATALCRLGVVLRKRAEFARARESFEHAIAISEKTLGPDNPDVARALTGLAAVLIPAGQPREAVAPLERALAIQKRASGPENDEMAKTLAVLGSAHRAFGDFRAALTYDEQALALRERLNAPDSPEVCGALNNLANVERELGLFDQARSHHERALTISEATYGAEHSNTAAVLHSLAVELVDMGDLAGARPLRERALRIDEKALRPNHPNVIDDLMGLADLLREGGDFPRAEELYGRAIGLIETTLGTDQVAMANAADGLGSVMRETGRFAEAERLYARALEIFQKQLGPEHPDIARILANMAKLREATGHPDEARDLYRRALTIWEKGVGDEPLLTAAMRGELAGVLTTLGEREEAADLLRSAVPALRDGYGADSLPYARALEHQARLDAVSGRRDAAVRGSLMARSISRALFEDAARGLSEREALMFESGGLVPLDLPITILTARPAVPDGPARVWDEIVRSRAMVLDEIAARHRGVRDSVSPEVEALLQALARDRAALAHLTIRGPDTEMPKAYAAALKQAREREEKSERALALASRSDRPEPPTVPPDLKAVARALPEGSGLVGYTRFTRVDARRDGTREVDYAAFVLGPGRAQPVVIGLGPAPAIEERIAAWRRDVESDPRLDPAGPAEAERRYRQSAGRLRETIWDPLAGPLAGARRIFVVPDGALHAVSFATLPDASGRYLVESGPALHYLSSERDLLPKAGERKGSGILALADPAYDGATGPTKPLAADRAPAASTRAGIGCRPFRSLEFRPLPESRREVESIQRILAAAPRGPAPDQVLVLAGAGADEGSFKRAAPGRRILHLATHGFFLDADCLEGSQEGDPAGPLGLAGLALAGANRRNAGGAPPDGEDGVLTAEEIASLDLSSAEWVVLSACESGAGRIQNGEGILGLRRAFQTAGAGTLLMSLWAIDDSATRAWMEALYRERASGRNTPESVGAASRTLIDAQRHIGGTTHPYFWGAFVAAGDWR
jgi:CHAT domain-containing protein/tetratricopeptide (TPR) repeat protein